MKPSDIVSNQLNSSEHLLLQQAGHPESICRDEISAKLHQLESSHMQLTKQLADTSVTLRQRTLGFEAMTIVVKHLTEKVTEIKPSVNHINIFTLMH